MKLIWHLYDRGEGKTTEAIDLFLDTPDCVLIEYNDDILESLLLRSNKLIEKLKADKDSRCVSFSNCEKELRGLRPKMIIVDDIPSEKRDLLFPILEKLCLEDNTIYHIYLTPPSNILKSLKYPQKANEIIKEVKDSVELAEMQIETLKSQISSLRRRTEQFWT